MVAHTAVRNAIQGDKRGLIAKVTRFLNLWPWGQYDRNEYFFPGKGQNLVIKKGGQYRRNKQYMNYFLYF